MPLHKEVRILPYTADQMYAVVAAVADYPDFLPWCESLTVLSRETKPDGEYVTAKMCIGFHGLRESYTSLVKLDPDARMIEARHVKGPFKRLDTRWRFVPLERGSEIHFLIDFAFKNPLLSAVANAAFGLVASRMADAFVQRAAALYASKELS